MSFKILNDAPVHYHQMNTTVFNRRTAEACATLLLPHLKPHFRILDLECGPGSIALDLVKLIPHGPVVEIDVSAGMPHPISLPDKESDSRFCIPQPFQQYYTSKKST